MRIHLTVAGHNLTPYIVAGTYNIYSEDVYESWNDGNMLEHRVEVTQKVKGSFDIACSEKANSLKMSDFLDYWNSAVLNKVATIGIYVVNTNSFEAIECYYTIKPKRHALTGDGNFVDVLTITIKER